MDKEAHCDFVYSVAMLEDDFCPFVVFGLDEYQFSRDYLRLPKQVLLVASCCCCEKQACALRSTPTVSLWCERLSAEESSPTSNIGALIGCFENEKLHASRDSPNKTDKVSLPLSLLFRFFLGCYKCGFA